MHKLILLFVSFISFTLLSCENNEPDIPEEDQIVNYIKAKNITVSETTASGLRVVLTKTNPTGKIAKIGSVVNIRYKGKLLNDKVFDSGDYPIVIGERRVVGGWLEGIPKFKEGEKGIIIFPSRLGYGSSGSGNDIPAYAPLVFDIEILSIK